MGKVWHKVWRQEVGLLGGTRTWRRVGRAPASPLFTETIFKKMPKFRFFIGTPTLHPGARELHL
jgi:hypothetical protein